MSMNLYSYTAKVVKRLQHFQKKFKENSGLLKSCIVVNKNGETFDPAVKAKQSELTI